MSGYPEYAAAHGTEFTYQLAPRAKIFRRDEGTVVDLVSILQGHSFFNEKVDL
jgi:hypothetical protein